MLHFHEVRCRAALLAFLADGAGLLDGAAVEEEFFCHGSFAGVGVRDYCDVASTLDFELGGGVDAAGGSGGGEAVNSGEGEEEECEEEEGERPTSHRTLFSHWRFR